ncbi:polyketide cyclase/dehydrase/lipid transport protein [Salana multivorans]|uniref:Polyketide cyclase/dehydrase/lipid transport protein n=1 Tax=Salana multivorans TaxID=120377 RepID=A0A3N2DBN0_9MICO|nr:SRPBCC family protein [Salana multivorans]ROR97137.1 polyketide cyclase/dehydrase/lipid transport protein [Salana multivorans]
MPVVESSIVVPIDPATAFAVSQTTGATRLRWDPFVRRQRFLDDAVAPARGVRTLTRHTSGLTMVSEYVSYAPPTNVGMRMVTGPWFFANLAGGWRFKPADGGTLATWKYSFACRPAWLAPLAERIGARVLQREIDRRIAGFARGCADPVVLAEVRAGA